MIRDIYLGLLVVAVAVISIAHRNLPKFASSTEVATETSANELPPPKKEAAAPADALTTVFPEGYKGSKSKKAESSSRSSITDAAAYEKSTEKKPKADKPKKDEDAAPIGAGPVLLVDEGPSLPVMPELAEGETNEKEDSATTAEEKKDETEQEEIVTEFVPFTEKLSLPDNGEEKPGEDSIASDAPKLSEKPEKEEKQLAANPPELFPPPGKRDADPASSEPPILALPQDHGSEPAGGSPKRTERAATKTDDLPPTVFSFDRRIATSDAPLAKDHSNANPVGGNPVHPFFARYLERKTYFVREGDTLESIAIKLYQDRSIQDRLFEVNKHQLRRPDDLRPGMLLRLP